VKKYGTNGVELDALPPIELRRRIEEAIKSHIDDAIWAKAQEIELQEKGRIQDAVNQWSSLTDAEAPRWAEFQSLRDDYPALWSAISGPDYEARKSLTKHLLEPFPNAGEAA
jgi:hypothetical protein